MPDCQHTRIVKSTAEASLPMWNCSRCGTQFIPAYAMDERISDVLDSTAGVMAAVMWDFHTRAVEKYGVSLSDGPMIEPDCRETGEHADFLDGRCVDCGASQFLGG